MAYKGNRADGRRDANYLASASKLFSEEERVDIEALVAADPECGKGDPRNGRVSKGPGCTQRNGEKWWGTRCVYRAQPKIPVFRITVFSKNEKKSLDGRAQRSKETGPIAFSRPPPGGYPRKSNSFSGSLQTRVFFSFTVNFSFVIMFRIVSKASSALPRQQITRSSA